jgi:hypothetical protein
MALMGKPEAKRPLRRQNHTWEDNIELLRNEMRKEDLNCNSLSQAMGRHRARVKRDSNVPSVSIQCRGVA